MKIISRKEAKALGLKRYFTGKPCKWAHVGERHVAGKACIECSRQRQRKNPRKKNLEKQRANQRLLREKNPEKERARRRKWYAKNREKVRAHQEQMSRERRAAYRLLKSLGFNVNQEKTP